MSDNLKRSEKVIDSLKRLLKGKAESYEIFYSMDSGLGIEAKDNEVDSLKVRSNEGAGLRVISGNRQGFGFSSVLTEEALKDMVASTIGGAREAAQDEFLSFPGAGGTEVLEKDLGLFDDSFARTPEEEKIKTALSIEEAARSFDARVKRVRKASYSESLHFSRIVNSNGADSSHRATFYSGSVTAVAEALGESQMGWEIGMGHDRGAVEPDRIGRGAAGNAVRLLGAKKIKTIKCPAIFENIIACEFLESLAPSFLGDNVLKGKSMLIGKAGKKVASPRLNIRDDGILPGGWASSAFDGEGVERGRTSLLDGGVCRGFLYDTYWAARAGVKSTGNSSRSNFKSYPGIGISNLYIEKGEKGREELFKEVSKGLFITEVLGVHTINPVSGDFSLGASGFWVEGGRAEYPVRGMAISGNLLDLFSKVDGCASDIRFIGSIGAPSLLINEIEASGT
ncbi:MAG: TldD/PmbA family protein [Deltaproteobacteria bacterium]|nr:TldD/PmbA family protein [Deltaproteobacteria bacterium]